MTRLAVSDAALAQLKQIASARGTTTEEVAEQAIREFLRSEARRRMQREMEAFMALHGELLEAYAGQYVAVHQGQVVDHDSDQLALYLRIEQRFHGAPVLIKQVLKDPQEVYTFRSPRLAGSRLKCN